MKYGFGIVGLGMIADFHARAIEEMEEGYVAACYSRSAEKAAAFGKKFGCTGYTNYREFLAHQGLDIVSVCTPSGLHLEPTLEAVEAGKHVIVEKPLEVTLKRCDAMIEGAERNGVLLAGIFPSRFHEIASVIKSTVDSGRFGTLSLGDAYVKWYRSQKYYDEGGWKGTWKYDGGGALMNQSIHAIDLLQWFMGPVASLQATTGMRGHERIEVEDTAVAVLRFENGALGVIEGTTSVYPGFLKRIEISGSRGSVILEEEDLKYWQFDEEQEEDARIRDSFLSKTKTGGGASDPSAIGYHGHQAQFQDLCRAIDEGRTPLVDGPEARKSVQIILAIYESAKSGRRVDLPLK